MLTNNKIKLINSLKQKKNRDVHGLFIAEGEKVVQEFIDSRFEIEEIFSNDPFKFSETTKVSAKELSRVSNLKTPNNVLGLFKIPQVEFDVNQLKGSVTIALDELKDPGNLGTIIRIADWFGISNIICSEKSVDVYNPKVIQSTMGSLTRVNIHYEDLSNILRSSEVKSYGALLDGDNIYSTQKITEGIIVFGNESKGIGKEVLHLLDNKITIPRIGGAESLNAAVSVGIICSELFRKTL
ncbi:MAG: RNA methyltransferase [Flavobacteriales bacterium]|nr:RNA methyltransferase [Flavobacteriales bacterium]